MWANIGVQIFFFMSGFLYSRKDIPDGLVWLKKNVLKIMKPYWIYLVIILPIIAILAPGEVTPIKAVVAYLGLQGFGGNLTIEGIGQHWFISYLLICYLITPYALSRMKSVIGGGYCWIILIGEMAVGQIVTVPLAQLI